MIFRWCHFVFIISLFHYFTLPLILITTPWRYFLSFSSASATAYWLFSPLLFAALFSLSIFFISLLLSFRIFHWCHWYFHYYWFLSFAIISFSFSLIIDYFHWLLIFHFFRHFFAIFALSSFHIFIHTLLASIHIISLYCHYVFFFFFSFHCYAISHWLLILHIAIELILPHAITLLILHYCCHWLLFRQLRHYDIIRLLSSIIITDSHYAFMIIAIGQLAIRLHYSIIAFAIIIIDIAIIIDNIFVIIDHWWLQPFYTSTPFHWCFISILPFAIAIADYWYIISPLAIDFIDISFRAFFRFSLSYFAFDAFDITLFSDITFTLATLRLPLRLYWYCFRHWAAIILPHYIILPHIAAIHWYWLLLGHILLLSQPFEGFRHDSCIEAALLLATLAAMPLLAERCILFILPLILWHDFHWHWYWCWYWILPADYAMIDYITLKPLFRILILFAAFHISLLLLP